MTTNNQMKITKDLTGKKIIITRNFDAELEKVWDAWTQSELLDKWWAPKPWRAETKSMQFKPGGTWLYAMVGPDDTRHWAKIDFLAIDTHKSYEGIDCFCDEQGNKNEDMPSMHWKNEFEAVAAGTQVTVNIAFKSESDIQKIIEMGFESGFTAALSNLDQYLAEQFRMRQQLKTDSKPRVTTYLNFPGTTEEAFNFYRSVFGTEFNGAGIKRFGDIPAGAGNPPVADSVKKMVLHVELPILGDHILMATDAPKEMGFVLSQGNNMHICLEPSTREETKSLFDALSEGGTVTMPLQDMFFGAYYGSCTDRFGINWMLNCIRKDA